jgi:cytochrome P450 family 135
MAAEPRIHGDVAPMPPGPRMPPLLQTAMSAAAPIRFAEQCRRRFGNCFTVRMVPPLGTTVHVADPTLVKVIFTSSPDAFTLGEGAAIFEPVLGSNSITLLDGPRHLRRRRILLPRFHGPRLKSFEQLIRDQTVDELSRWPSGKPFELRPRMQSITLEVMMRAVFGIEDPDRLRDLRPRLERLVVAIMSPALLLMAKAGRFGAMSRRTPWGRLRLSVRAVDKLLLEDIRRRRADSALEEREDILSMLLLAEDEEGNALTDSEIRNELVTMLLAGHVTTATAAAWTFERLLRDQRAVDKIREELAVGETGYLVACIKEALRIRPTIPFISRYVREPVALNGYVVPPGMRLILWPYLIHHRADIYRDPGEFRPERFLEGSPDGYTWIPFGGSTRRCIGASFAMMELEQIIATVLREAELRLVDPEPEEMQLQLTTIVPKRDVRVMLRDRSPRTVPDPAFP